jgi:hypothetical protein
MCHAIVGANAIYICLIEFTTPKPAASPTVVARPLTVIDNVNIDIDVALAAIGRSRCNC